MGIISPTNGALVHNKLVFSGSQLATALVEQYTATKEVGYAPMQDPGEFGKRGSVPLNENKKQIQIF
jgi:hypothetical protein